ncbi:MAG: adenylosuccinate synthase [Bryobacteraceae bacterium]
MRHKVEAAPAYGRIMGGRWPARAGCYNETFRSIHMNNVIVLGAQWGDEGKGKVVDLFSEKFDIVARYQGGHNAGHTVRIGERKIVLKLVPTGILRPGKQAVIGNGVVVEPAALLEEIDGLARLGIEVQGRLFISNRAHVILPFHRMAEKLSESRPGRAIGTTSRGIGPCYEDKIGRRGIRMGDLAEEETFRALYDALAEDKEILRAAFSLGDPVDFARARDQYIEYGRRLAPMVTDTAALLNRAMAAGRRVLFEGAQGTMLDVDHGTYPYVTSSTASAGGASPGAGVPPTCIGAVVGVSKAYATRVGGGPFPTESHDEAGNTLRTVGNEFGAVTGRPRRCGWFDVPLLRYTAMLNGFDSLVLTKLDVLDGFAEIPVATSYRLRGQETMEMPATAKAMAELEPVYTLAPGWQAPTAGLKRYEDLPARAKDYLAFLSEQVGVEIGCISTGPERTQTIIVPGSKLERILG